MYWLRMHFKALQQLVFVFLGLHEHVHGCTPDPYVLQFLCELLKTLTLVYINPPLLPSFLVCGLLALGFCS